MAGKQVRGFSGWHTRPVFPHHPRRSDRWGVQHVLESTRRHCLGEGRRRYKRQPVSYLLPFVRTGRESDVNQKVEPFSSPLGLPGQKTRLGLHQSSQPSFRSFCHRTESESGLTFRAGRYWILALWKKGSCFSSQSTSERKREEEEERRKTERER